MQNLPFPSNDQNGPVGHKRIAKRPGKQPWQYASVNEGPAIMLTLQLVNGTEVSYCYSDLRETRLINPGYLQLCIYGFEKYLVTIEGRRLQELAASLGQCKIKSIREMGEQTFDQAEDEPAVEKIVVDTLTGPSL